MSLLLKEFKDNMELIILQSNNYLEWAGEYQILCQYYKIGMLGDNVFKVVFDELEKRLKAEKIREAWAKDALENQTGTLEVPRKSVINERNDY